MPAQKIVLYFTPDIQEPGRIPLSDIKFDTSKYLERGKYEISLNHPCFISGNCASVKSSVKSTATLTFLSKCFGDLSKCFGEKTNHVFKVNDYFEIWDTADKDDSWCYFRGIIQQTSSDHQGSQRRYTVNLENAAGWILGDNSIYYLNK